MLAGLSRIKHSLPRIRSWSLRLRASSARPFFSSPAMFVSLISLALLISVMACRSDSDSQRIRPRQLRDVPARAFAFNFQADVEPPSSMVTEEAKTLPAIQQDFDTRRKDDALLRTIVSPDGHRALALYGTVDEATQTFRIDLYSADGNFLRNVTPPELAVVFQDSVAWSADGGFIAFVGRPTSQAKASPTPLDDA